MQRSIAADDPGQDLLAVAVRICSHPMDLLARRDVRRLSQLCGANDASIKEAIALIGRLEPKPGRRFVNVERNIVIPDVLVVQVGKGGHARFRAQINPQVMPRLRVHDIYANALRQHRGNGSDASNYAALQQRLQEARWFIKNIQQRFDTILRVSTRHRRAAEELLPARRTGDASAGVARDRRRARAARVHHQPRHDRQVHGHAAGYLRVEVLLWLLAGHRDRWQCIEHRGSGADQAIHRRRVGEQAACPTISCPRCSRSKASPAPGAPWPSTAKACASRRPICAGPCEVSQPGSTVNQLQLFLALRRRRRGLSCAGGGRRHRPVAGSGAEVARRCDAAGLLARRHAAQPAQPAGAARAGAVVPGRLPQRAGPVPGGQRGGLGDLVHAAPDDQGRGHGAAQSAQQPQFRRARRSRTRCATVFAPRPAACGPT